MGRIAMIAMLWNLARLLAGVFQWECQRCERSLQFRLYASSDLEPDAPPISGHGQLSWAATTVMLSSVTLAGCRDAVSVQ